MFNCNTLEEQCWAIDGIMTERNKGRGAGLMVAAMCSHEFGFGFRLTNEQLGIVNAYRDGKKYIDGDAALNLFGTDKMQALTTSPFVRLFAYGKGNLDIGVSVIWLFRWKTVSLF